MKITTLEKQLEILDKSVKTLDQHIKHYDREDTVVAKFIRDNIRYQVSVAAANLEQLLLEKKK